MSDRPELIEGGVLTVGRLTVTADDRLVHFAASSDEGDISLTPDEAALLSEVLIDWADEADRRASVWERGMRFEMLQRGTYLPPQPNRAMAERVSAIKEQMFRESEEWLTKHKDHIERVMLVPLARPTTLRQYECRQCGLGFHFELDLGQSSSSSSS